MIEKARVETRKAIEDLAAQRLGLKDKEAIIAKIEAAIAKSELGQALEANRRARDTCQENIAHLETQLQEVAVAEWQVTGDHGLLCEGACYIQTKQHESGVSYSATVVSDLSVVIKSWQRD